MTNIEIITLSNTVLTTVTLALAYFNYSHSRKKDFQDKLYQLKLDAYKDLNAKCYDAYLALSSNAEPFDQLNEIDTPEEWDKVLGKASSKLYKIGYGLQESFFGYAYLLPDKVLDQYHEYSNFCIGFATMAFHYDTVLIADNTDRLWDYYTGLVNLIRQDLNIEVIDKGLLKRVSRP